MDTIKNIIDKIPSALKEYLKAMVIIYRYVRTIIHDFINSHFHPHHIQELIDLEKLQKWFKRMTHLWNEVQSSLPTESIKRFVQKSIDTLTFAEQMFEDHVRQFLDLIIEHSGPFESIKRPLIRMRDAIPKWGQYVLSLNLTEMVANALEVVSGRPIWLKGNELSYEPEDGLFKMRFFLPKHIFHYFE